MGSSSRDRAHSLRGLVISAFKSFQKLVAVTFWLRCHFYASCECVHPMLVMMRGIAVAKPRRAIHVYMTASVRAIQQPPIFRRHVGAQQYSCPAPRPAPLPSLLSPNPPQQHTAVQASTLPHSHQRHRCGAVCAATLSLFRSLTTHALPGRGVLITDTGEPRHMQTRSGRTRTPW